MDFNTPTIAGVACSDGAVFATLPITLGAKCVPCQGEFCSLALVEIFECYMDTMDEIFRLSWAG